MSNPYGTLSTIKSPTSIPELIDYIKRRLGHPVVRVDVTDEQMYDRILDTLQIYRDFHYNGSQRTYIKWQVTQQDIDNKYITTNPNIIGVVRVFDPSNMNNNSSMFTNVEFWLRSQINFADFFGSTQSSFIEYFLTQQRISDMDQLFRSNPGSTFSKNEHKLFLNIDWTNAIKAGDYVVGECHTFLDPAIERSILSERFILSHATAGIKMQWGTNLKKYSGVSLPGGLSVDGQSIYSEGALEMQSLEDDLHNNDLIILPLIG